MSQVFYSTNRSSEIDVVVVVVAIDTVAYFGFLDPDPQKNRIQGSKGQIINLKLQKNNS